MFNKVVTPAVLAAWTSADAPLTSGLIPTRGTEGIRTKNTTPWWWILQDANGQTIDFIAPFTLTESKYLQPTEHVQYAQDVTMTIAVAAGGPSTYRLDWEPVPQKPSRRVISFPQLQAQVAELTGSLAPLNPLPPVLVATVPYSSLTASSAFFVEVTTLHANARERAWTVNNTLNEPLSGLKFAPFDTASNALSTATTLNAQEESSPTPPGSGNYVLYESRNIPILGTATDSMRVELDMGATAPTSGNVYVVVREVL